MKLKDWSTQEAFHNLLTDRMHYNIILLLLLLFLMSNFLEIDFVMKINDKRARRFDLSEVIFKCKKKYKKLA